MDPDRPTPALRTPLAGGARGRARLAPGLVLIFAVLALALVAAIAGPWEAVRLPAVLCGLALALLAWLDAVLGRARMEGWVVGAPALVRAALERKAQLQLRLERPRGLLPARLGLETPPAIEPVGLHMDLPHTESEPGKVSFSWPILPRERGDHLGLALQVEVPSPLSLWVWRQAHALPVVVRVHPDMGAERRGAAALFLPRGLAGLRVQRQVGRGREFEKLREYLPGDGIDEVHWKASARRAHPVTKVFQLEKAQEVYLVVDHSRLSGRLVEGPGGAPVPALERNLAAGLTLVSAAIRQGDRCGVAVCADGLRRLLPAAAGSAHFDACRGLLHPLRTEAVSPDYGEILSALAARLRRRSLLVFLADLEDPAAADQFVENARVLSRRHLLLVAQARPRALRPAFSGEDPGSVDGIYRELAWHLRWEEGAALARRLRAAGVEYAQIDAPELAVGVLRRYLDLRRRQCL